MNAKSIVRKRSNGEKKRSGKTTNHSSKPTRTKSVRSLTPKRLFDIIEHINDGLVVLDKDWYYVFVNQKAAEMLQRKKPSDLIGKHIWTEYPEGVGQPFHLAYEKAMREQVPIIFEDHYEPWDLWFENRIYPSPDGLMILFTEITERKRMERLLREQQHLLQKILDTEPGTVYIYDLEERRNIYVNRHWLSEFGYTAEETQAMGDELLFRIFHPDDLPRISAHHKNWRQAGDGDIGEIEYRVRTKTGEWRWLHSHEAPFARDESGRVKQILGISYEITPRMLAQEALRRKEQQLGQIYDTVTDIIFLLSIEPDDRYRFVSVNKAFLHATDLKNDQVVGRYADEIIPPASQPMVFGNYKKAIQERIPVTWEEVSEYPAGTKTVIVTINAVYNETGICTHLVGAVHDITGIKQAEKALRESEEKFSKVFHASPIALTIRRVSDGRYLEVNESFLKHLGYQREEVIGRTGLEIGAWANPKEREEMLQILREQGSLRHFESQFRTKSGEIGTALLFREIIELAGEKYFIGTTLDITERKQMEEVVLKERDFSAAMLNSLPGVFYFYDQTGKFLRWNRNLEIVSGYSGAEIAGMHPLDFFMGAEKEYIAQRIQQVFENGESDAEAYFVTKHGERIPYYFTGRRLDIDGSPYLIGMGIDITQRKQAEEEKVQLLVDLRERVKELTVLHATMELLQHDRGGTVELLQAITDLIPLAWRYPEIAAARLVFAGHETRTGNFTPTPW
ncbi:MAG TPA: PAS domain S-box protein, partial [Anaerolineales bacterium]|nr:PAS domain S-box protein [Anaerolineales bacterium]